MKIEICIDGECSELDLDIAYRYIPGDPGDRINPPCAAEVEIYSVKAKGIDIYELLNLKQLIEIENNILRQHED